MLFCLPVVTGGLAAESVSSAEAKRPLAPPQVATEGSLGRGVAYCKQGDWDKAIKELDEAIRLNPRDATAYCYRGGAYCGGGELDKAISDFTRQIELDGTNGSGYFNRGSAYRAKRDFTNAISDFTRCLQLWPTDAVVYKNRAAVYDALGELDKAISDWNKGLRLSPGDATAHAVRGHAYHAKGQFDEALLDYQEAIRLERTNDLAYNNLAWLRATCPDAAMRNAVEAVEAGKKACELTGWSNWTRVDTLAAAFAEAGDFKKAARYERQAMGMEGPSKEELKEMESRLLLYEQEKPYRQMRRLPKSGGMN
jgi:tetratricopeptide (TPR) repeat protein